MNLKSLLGLVFGALVLAGMRSARAKPKAKRRWKMTQTMEPPVRPKHSTLAFTSNCSAFASMLHDLRRALDNTEHWIRENTEIVDTFQGGVPTAALAYRNVYVVLLSMSAPTSDACDLVVRTCVSLIGEPCPAEDVYFGALMNEPDRREAVESAVDALVTRVEMMQHIQDDRDAVEYDAELPQRITVSSDDMDRMLESLNREPRPNVLLRAARAEINPFEAENDEFIRRWTGNEQNPDLASMHPRR